MDVRESTWAASRPARARGSAPSPDSGRSTTQSGSGSSRGTMCSAWAQNSMAVGTSLTVRTMEPIRMRCPIRAPGGRCPGDRDETRSLDHTGAVWTPGDDDPREPLVPRPRHRLREQDLAHADAAVGGPDEEGLHEQLAAVRADRATGCRATTAALEVAGVVVTRLGQPDRPGCGAARPRPARTGRGSRAPPVRRGAGRTAASARPRPGRRRLPPASRAPRPREK